MKMLAALTLAILSTFAVNAFACEPGPGTQTFCRTVETGGMFGQPAGTRQHCVSVSRCGLTDNANTFFGNPPETLPWKLVGHSLFVLRNGQWEFAYAITDLGLENGAGAILTKVK